MAVLAKVQDRHNFYGTLLGYFYMICGTAA